MSGKIRCPHCKLRDCSEASLLELDPSNDSVSEEICENPECFKEFDILFNCSYTFTITKKESEQKND